MQALALAGQASAEKQQTIGRLHIEMDDPLMVKLLDTVKQLQPQGVNQNQDIVWRLFLLRQSFRRWQSRKLTQSYPLINCVNLWYCIVGQHQTKRVQRITVYRITRLTGK